MDNRHECTPKIRAILTSADLNRVSLLQHTNATLSILFKVRFVHHPFTQWTFDFRFVGFGGMVQGKLANITKVPRIVKCFLKLRISDCSLVLHTGR